MQMQGAGTDITQTQSQARLLPTAVGASLVITSADIPTQTVIHVAKLRIFDRLNVLPFTNVIPILSQLFPVSICIADSLTFLFVLSCVPFIILHLMM
jgi:hypothetical protein